MIKKHLIKFNKFTNHPKHQLSLDMHEKLITSLIRAFQQMSFWREMLKIYIMSDQVKTSIKHNLNERSNNNQP